MAVPRSSKPACSATWGSRNGDSERWMTEAEQMLVVDILQLVESKEGLKDVRTRDEGAMAQSQSADYPTIDILVAVLDNPACA